MKRLLSILTTLAALALAAAAVTANGHVSHSARQTTIPLDTQITAQKRVDEAPTGDSPDDTALASGDVLTRGTHKKVGRFLLNCVNIPPAHGECTITFALRRGHIAILASYGKGFSGDSSARDPIVGGTGAYRNARGYDSERETGEGTSRFTLHLTR